MGDWFVKTILYIGRDSPLFACNRSKAKASILVLNGHGISGNVLEGNLICPYVHSTVKDFKLGQWAVQIILVTVDMFFYQFEGWGFLLLDLYLQ